MVGKRDIPTLVKVIAVLHYISAAISLLLGFLLIVGASVFSGALSSYPGLSAITGTVGVLVALIIIALAILNIFIGRGLWLGQKWARIVSIVIMALGFLSSLGRVGGGRFGNIFWVIVYGGLGAYLIFDKKVKKAFK